MQPAVGPARQAGPTETKFGQAWSRLASVATRWFVRGRSARCRWTRLTASKCGDDLWPDRRARPVSTVHLAVIALFLSLAKRPAAAGKWAGWEFLSPPSIRQRPWALGLLRTLRFPPRHIDALHRLTANLSRLESSSMFPHFLQLVRFSQATLFIQVVCTISSRFFADFHCDEGWRTL
jgi:hypothetical protein